MSTTGPVPQRMAALLSSGIRPPRATSWGAVLLAVCALASCATAASVALRVHQDIEVAQGEAGH
ncbi:hypothetical protein [Streptomyces sp. NPDC052496]|uniref:hypothetical protein n=1 Tax=Streptomyces sp. NPDC052496 TaxID=3154951 RepID=UPI0034493F48